MKCINQRLYLFYHPRCCSSYFTNPFSLSLSASVRWSNHELDWRPGSRSATVGVCNYGLILIVSHPAPSWLFWSYCSKRSQNYSIWKISYVRKVSCKPEMIAGIPVSDTEMQQWLSDCKQSLGKGIHLLLTSVKQAETQAEGFYCKQRCLISFSLLHTYSLNVSCWVLLWNISPRSILRLTQCHVLTWWFMTLRRFYERFLSFATVS